jgi:hypothetical protein
VVSQSIFPPWPRFNERNGRVSNRSTCLDGSVADQCPLRKDVVMHPKSDGLLESSLDVLDISASARFYARIFGFAWSATSESGLCDASQRTSGLIAV